MTAMRGDFSEATHNHLNDIDFHGIGYRSNNSNHAAPITNCGSASNCPYLPPPTKFNRKAKKSDEVSLSLSMTTRTTRPNAALDGVYKLHRQYVRTLIMEEAAFPTNPSPRDEWILWDYVVSTD